MSHPTDDKEPIRSESDTGGESRAGSSAEEKPQTSDTGSRPARAADAATSASGGEATGKSVATGAGGPDEKTGTPAEALKRTSQESADRDAQAGDSPSVAATESGVPAAEQAGAPDSSDGEPAETVTRGSDADTEGAVPVAGSGAEPGEETAPGADAGSDEPARAADSPSTEAAPAEETGAQAPSAEPDQSTADSGPGGDSGQTGADSPDDVTVEVPAASAEVDAEEVSGAAATASEEGGAVPAGADASADEAEQTTGGAAAQAGAVGAAATETAAESVDSAGGTSTSADPDAGLAEPGGSAAEVSAASAGDAEETAASTGDAEAVTAGTAESAGDAEAVTAGTAASAGAAETVTVGTADVETAAAETAEPAGDAEEPAAPAGDTETTVAAGLGEDATAEITVSGTEPDADAAGETADEAAGAGPDEGATAAEKAPAEAADIDAATEGDDAATADPTVELEAPAGTEAKTVVIPRPQRSEEAPTESISVRKPDPNATERIDMSQVRSPGRPGTKQPGGPQGPARTDRVGPGTAGPLSKPPNTPRPQSGPKRPGPQAPSRPDQSAPQRPGGPAPAAQGAGGSPGAPRPAGGPGRTQAGQRPAGAPSPADIKPTVAEHRVTQSPQYGAPGQIAQPQRVEPAAAPAGSTGNRKWLIAAGAAVVVVIALIAIVAGIGSGDDSPQARIRTAIGDYTGALERGDLAGLRDITCGGLYDYYQGLSEEQFAAVHRQAVDSGSIPDVTGVDAVQITDRTALAQVTVQTEADSAQTTRTFDLQETDDGWKVCDPPGTP